MNDQFLDEEVIVLPSFSRLTFKEKVEARKKFVDIKVEEFKVKHLKLIMNGYPYTIFLTMCP